MMTEINVAGVIKKKNGNPINEVEKRLLIRKIMEVIEEEDCIYKKEKEEKEK